MRHCPSLLRCTAIVLSVLLFTACSASPPDAGRGEPQDRPAPSGLAQVDSVEVVLLESFPVQVHVLVKGNLPNGCTSIDQVRQRRDLENKTFWVEITTARPANAICTEALVPYEERIPLDALNLPAGAYTVDVNGERAGFIATEPTGNHGFGYDPIFYLPELGKTMAELPPEEKNKTSHRGQAAEKASRLLESLRNS